MNYIGYNMITLYVTILVHFNRVTYNHDARRSSYRMIYSSVRGYTSY